ncbi:MAG: hypothetical protein ACD_58C00060G0001 [uncultured bacterium]|nr:MAG: hypothetical protein ACD_58C00060G0001 [uncultured bacterium]
MAPNKLVKISSILLVISLLFFLLTGFYYGFYKWQVSQPDKGVITRVGEIVNFERENNYLNIKINNKSIKLIANYNSKMLIPSSIEQKNLDFSKINVGDSVLVEYDASNNVIKSLTKITIEDQNLKLIKGKITKIDNRNLEIRTLELYSKNYLYVVGGQTFDIIDNTNGKNQVMQYNSLKINDDVIIEFDNQKNVKNIYLIKVGPKS